MSDRLTITPLIGLLQGQPREVIETLTIEEIRKHRLLIGEATALEQRLANVDGQEGQGELELAYLSKMVALHTQQTALSTIIDILGYIPEVPGDSLN